VNVIRRCAAVLILSSAALPGLGAETVIDQLYGLRAYDLADAYWAAGQRFIDLGQADRGAEFQAKAKKLFPGYVPGQAPPTQAAPAVPASAPAAAPAVPAADTVREKNLQGQKIARLQFQKLLRGYLTGSAATLASALGSPLTVQGEAADPAGVRAFLDAHPAEVGSPDELFDLDSLEAADGAGTQILVTVKAAADAPAGLAELLPFWKPVQTYTFSRIGETWKLTAVEGR